MKYKNYYKILELKSDRISDEEIKNAYRRLAKKYHPDINPGDSVASEKFKDVNEAYQVLGDEASKRKYDRIHNIYRVKDSFEDAKEKFNKEGFSDMFDIMFGKKEQKIYKDAKKQNAPIQGDNLESQIDITIEEAFFGVEKRIAYKTSDGSTKNISVKVPKGIRNDERIRIAGQGKEGKNGGKNGDLYIRVNIMKDDRFEIRGNDLYMLLNITPWEAAFGCSASVKGIDNAILITVPEGVQSGERLKVAKNGFWNEHDGRGDLILVIQIVMPKRLTEGERLLLKKLSEISDFSPR